MGDWLNLDFKKKLSNEIPPNFLISLPAWEPTYPLPKHVRVMILFPFSSDMSRLPGGFQTTN